MFVWACRVPGSEPMQTSPALPELTAWAGISEVAALMRGLQHLKEASAPRVNYKENHLLLLRGPGSFPRGPSLTVAAWDEARDSSSRILE